MSQGDWINNLLPISIKLHAELKYIPFPPRDLALLSEIADGLREQVVPCFADPEDEDESDGPMVPLSKVNRHWVTAEENSVAWWRSYVAMAEAEEKKHCGECRTHLRAKATNGRRKKLPEDQQLRRRTLYRAAEQALQQHLRS